MENRPASIACANSRDPPYIPIAKARGITAAFDNSQKEKSAPSLHQNYTIVYDTNAGRIGSLDKKTAAAVVLAYTHLKELVDTINAYLDTCQKYINSNERGTPYVTYYQTVQNLCKTLENLKPRAAASIEEAIRLLS